MRIKMLSPVTGLILSLLVLTAVWCLDSAQASSKVELYGARMTPNNDDADDFTRPGWGVGFRLVAPLSQPDKILAGVFGFDWVNLMDKMITRYDPVTLLRAEQTTSQDYARLYLGAEVGGHGPAFFRPFAGANLAFVYYSISSTLVIPNDLNPDLSIHQDLGSEGNVRFGYDLTLGADLNFNNKWNLVGGVRYLKSFGVPQQLPEGSVTIHPDYFQIFCGVGVSLSWIKKESAEGQD